MSTTTQVGAWMANAEWTEAIIQELKALDKYRASMSDDIVAFGRLILRKLDSVPSDMRQVLLTTIIERVVHFGTFWSPMEHRTLGPLLQGLADGNTPQERQATIAGLIKESEKMKRSS